MNFFIFTSTKVPLKNVGCKVHVRKTPGEDTGLGFSTFAPEAPVQSLLCFQLF